MFDIKQKSVELQESCGSCGKPIGKGTITGWIVGEELQSLYDRWGCTCASEGSAQAVSKNDLAIAQSEQVIGRWLLKSQIGSGYMGNVYLAENTAANEKVAIRIFNPILSQNRRIAKRFLQEAEKAATLTHQNIAMVYEHGTLPDGSVYVVSEYVEGISLQEKLKEEGFLDVKDALAVVTQLCDALEEAHRQGILHRSIKPSTILIQPSGSIKLIDFGLEKAVPVAGKVTQCLSQVSGELGNPRYMSPEQCLGETLDERSDLYSIGCVMYEMLTGKEIFEEHKGFLVALAQLREKPRPFSEVMYNSEIPASVETVVLRMLEKSRDDRYASVKQLGEDVEAVAAGKEPAIASKSLVRQKPPPLTTKYPVRPRKQLLVGLAVIMGSVFLFTFTLAIFFYMAITAPLVSTAPQRTMPLYTVPASKSQHLEISDTASDGSSDTASDGSSNTASDDSSDFASDGSSNTASDDSSDIAKDGSSATPATSANPRRRRAYSTYNDTKRPASAEKRTSKEAGQWRKFKQRYSD